MTQKKLLYFVILILSATLLFTSCGDENNITNNPSLDSKIIISPDEIMINDDEEGSLFISIHPANEFEWKVSAKPDWIEISPSSGKIKSEITELKLKAITTGLSEGNHIGEIEIITNGAGKAEVMVGVSVDANPKAEVNPTELVYSVNDVEKTITITNTGTGYLNWEIQSLPTWINLNIQSGYLSESESITLMAKSIRKGLSVGIHQGQAVFVSNSKEENINIDFTLNVEPTAIMTLSKDSIIYGYFEDSKSFYIKNEGNTSFDWSWEDNSNSFLSVNPNSGSIPVGDSVKVNMLLDRSTLKSQDYKLDVLIKNNQGHSLELPVKVHHYEESKWQIKGRVIDAEYDKNNDIIVVVSESPNEIRVFNPENQSVETLALNIPPTCVSVSMNGKFAAVGHNGSFSYINLTTMSMVKNYGVTADAFDIVLAPNDWVYVFPRRDQWERIRCINLTTGVETEHTGGSIYHQTKAKLHPSGDYIYGANNGLSPSDIEKYEIKEGTAKMLYDSPYHGDFAFSGDLWLSEDGNRIFARSKNVFNSSENKTNDMTYNGALVGDGIVKTLDFSSRAEKICAIFTTGSSWNGVPSDLIRVYETEYLGFQGTIELPGFLIPDGTGGGKFYKSQGYYGFFNSTGTKFNVIVKVEEGSGTQNEWAIVTVDID